MSNSHVAFSVQTFYRGKNAGNRYLIQNILEHKHCICNDSSYFLFCFTTTLVNIFPYLVSSSLAGKTFIARKQCFASQCCFSLIQSYCIEQVHVNIIICKFKRKSLRLFLLIFLPFYMIWYTSKL